MSEELVTHAATGAPEAAGVDWALGQSFSLPVALRELLTERAPRESLAALASSVAPALRARAMYTEVKPASSRLPFSYRLVPGPLRRAIASVVGRWQRSQQHRWARFPGWPIDLSADFASDLAGLPRTVPGGLTPVVLSHDLDSPEGLRNLVERFLSIEETVGGRSVNFVIPFGGPLDHALIGEVQSRGHEIGIHGFDHSNRTPFVPAEERRARLDAARPLIERYGVVGYRAPSLVRTRALIADLRRLYRYDSSIPTSGGPFPVPNNGCASARPFPLCGFWEIPVSMPRDGTLRFLGHTPGEISRIWRDCAERIARSGGVVVLLTHCERGFSGNEAMLSAYRQLVEDLAADGRYEFTTMSALLPRLMESSS